MRELVTVHCPDCGAELVVELEDGYASGLCEYCGQHIEVEDGEVHDPFANEFEPW